MGRGGQNENRRDFDCAAALKSGNGLAGLHGLRARTRLRHSRLTDRCARYAEEIAVLQEREKWVPVTERLPEVWRNDETSELVNYMIYSPDFGVDIGNYHANAKNGSAWHYLAPSRTGGRCRNRRRRWSDD